MRHSFSVLSARDRAFALVDSAESRELLGPFDHLLSPHLYEQNIVPESDDGVVLVRGKMKSHSVVVISIEGKFQGGGIGEIGGAKIVSALEKVLNENKSGNPIYPVLIFDTGGVRLQEANYGLLAISEIQNAIVELKKYIPVIGIIPGNIGVFGGMAITAAMCSYLIATDKARIGLNGPEVIEEEAGVQEFDSRDKAMIWRTIGASQRLATGIIDELVEDDIAGIKMVILKTINEKRKNDLRFSPDIYLKFLPDLNMQNYLEPNLYQEIFRQSLTEKDTWDKNGQVPSIRKSVSSRGGLWFDKLTNTAESDSGLGTVLSTTLKRREELITVFSIVPDADNHYPRVRHGEVGLLEGFNLAFHIEKIIEADRHKKQKRTILAIVDVPSQAYGYNEELIGLHGALAASAEQYACARQAGHPVIALVVGQAISGGFLAHGLQAKEIIAFYDSKVAVQAMSKKSIARVTKRSQNEIEQASDAFPYISYAIEQFCKLGSIAELIEQMDFDDPSEQNVLDVWEILLKRIQVIRQKPNDLHNRYQSKWAKEGGRKQTIKVRQLMDEQWGLENETT